MKPRNRFKATPRPTQIEELESREELPRIGKVRLGIKVKKKEGDKRCTHPPEGDCFYCTYPRDVDYFVCPPEVRAVYGDQPKELDIIIPVEDKGEWFPYSLKAFKGPRLFCWGNAKVATRIDQQTGETITMECPCELIEERVIDGKTVRAECGLRGGLMVVLYKVGISGCYQISTGSIHNIHIVNRFERYMRKLFQGRISGIPFILKRTMQPILRPDGKQTTKALFHFEIEKGLERVAMYRQRDFYAIVGGEKEPPKAITGAVGLPPPVEDLDDDAPGEVVIEENGETGAEPEKKSPEVAPGKEIPAEAREKVEPQKPPLAPPKGPPISTARVNILRALFRSKGIDKDRDMDALIFNWYGIAGLPKLPAPVYDECKDRISKIGTREPGADEGEDWIE